jgi:hypothetical protein
MDEVVAVINSLQLSMSYDATALSSFQKYVSTVLVKMTLTSALTSSLAKRRASFGPLTAATDPVIPSRMRGRRLTLGGDEVAAPADVIASEEIIATTSDDSGGEWDDMIKQYVNRYR